ncbi:NF038122 family metalloprotease [Bradyrhizobium erythrophlei]|uniref:Ig-like domain (Group 1) n=1 Tax=Bradyrhizobium erythrophlei TaxID=1437360 RepID=A0A1M5TG16_9BRAD|nr:NF038122 family metalloprotease [Bradyrhizobium erythrophlei]SHH49656.1 Ig-like domain (group 1) [Bradyrhizobium erythrophlei]
MNLVLDYESSALAAPQSFRDAMQTAANILDSTIQNNITVTIDIGYGDWDNGLITGLGTSAVGGDLYGSYVSYTTLRAALASHETSAVDQTFVNSLPTTSSVNGVSSFYVPSAVEKALGMISPTAPSIDGAVGIGTGIPTSDLVGVALHEFTHALGREPGAGTFDLTRYTSAGNHLFSSGSTAPAAYFSIDGGVTKLADYGQNSDPADFLNSGVQGANDPFNEFYSGSTTQSLSTVDKELLDAMGFNVTPSATGTPSATTSSLVASSPTVKADGTSTTTLTLTVKDANGNAVANTAVTLSASGSSNSFGTISGTTDANGVFKTTLASTLAQNETITASEGGVQEHASVSFVAGAASATTSSLVANAPTVTADGTTTTTLTVTVEDANGNAVAGTAVTLSGSGSANSFGATSGTTNANGVFTTTLASTLVQNETITATEGSVQEHASVSFVASAPSAATSSLVASSPTVAADGTSTTTLTVTVEDAQGHAVAGTAVTLSGSGSANSFGAISGTTNANGVFTTTLASTLVQNETITATEGSTQEHTSVSFVAGAPSATTSSLVASSPTVTADGSSTTILTVTVEDALGHAVAGTAVTLSGSGSANSFGAISGTTNANGVFTTTLASTLVQNETITATEGSVQEHASVSFVPTATVIQTAGSTSLAQIGSNFYLYTNGSGPELKFAGSAYAAGEFGAWSPFAAVQTASGYDVAWKNASSGTYTVWSADSNGNWISDLISNVSASSSTLESIEATFHQDLNGDGLIGVPTIVTQPNAPTSVAQIGSNYFLYTNGSGPELKFVGSAYAAGEFGAWSPFAAVQTATGYDVAWKDGTGDYTVWSADSNGNWISDLISNVSASSSTLESIEATFHQDLNGDGLIGVPTIVTQPNAPTSLAQIGSNYFLYTNGSGPELKFVGSAYAAGEFGAWSPFAAVQTATGYDVAWKDGTGDYTVWSADSNGNWISDLISGVSASSSTLESIEATFHQDLNGDGLIGVPTIVTQPNAPTSVAQIGSNYFLYTNGSGPELKFVGSAYAAGEFGAWSPFAAVQTATGYDVAWKDGTGDYTVWSADSNGNWISDLISNVSASSSTLESIEATFHQDLNGDGVIGVPTTTLPVATDMVIEAFGSTSLVEAGNNFYLNEFTDLKFSGAAVVAGQFGAWAPIGAEQTATGYEVAWKAVGADQYTVWNTDSDGNFTSYAVSAVSGSTTALETLETSFHQDLNGDGVIGIPPAATSPVASNNAGSNLVASGPVTTAAATSNDSFVFAPNFGHVTIANVAPLPDINFSHAVFANINALLAAAHDDGHGNVIITDATHDTLTIQNMTSQQLQAHQSDFHIV